MAEVSYPNLAGDDAEIDDGVVSFSPHTNTWSLDLDGFDVSPSDLDFPSSEYFLCRHGRCRDRTPLHEDASIAFHRENQVNFVIDMSHQRVEQSHSSSRVIVENDLVPSDRSFGLIEDDLEMDFGAELGLGFDRNDNDEDRSEFMIADCSDEFAPRTGARSDSGGENEIIGVDDDYGINGGCDEEASLRLCWDALHLEEEDDHVNEDFEWEEVDGRIEERDVLSMFLDTDVENYSSVIPPGDHEFSDEEQADALDWEVLLNVQNLEANPDFETPFDEYNEMFFGQFADNGNSCLIRPPASKRVVESLASVVMTLEDVEENNAHCAVCKDEIGVGEIAKQLPCTHWYHGDCIVPWLCIRNTCPVCRHELLTDDPDYERKKAERVQ